MRASLVGISISGLRDAKMGWKRGFSEGIEDLKETIAWIIIVSLFLWIIMPKIIEIFSQTGFDTTIIKSTLNMLYVVLDLLSVIGIVALLVAFCKAINDWKYGFGRASAILLGLPLLFVIIRTTVPYMRTEATGLMLLILVLLLGAILGFIVQTLQRFFS